MADLGLTNAVNSPKALLQAVGVPRQVVVHHQVGPLKVDPFSRSIGSNEYLNGGILFKGFLGFFALFSTHAAVNGDHRFRLAQQVPHSVSQIVEGISMFGEDNQLAPMSAGIKHLPLILQEFR